MTRKRSAATGFIRIPAAMAEAAIAELSSDQRDSLTPKQAANILQATTSCGQIIAHIISAPSVTILPAGPGEVRVVDKIPLSDGASTPPNDKDRDRG